jgi:hypothetical protein
MISIHLDERICGTCGAPLLFLIYKPEGHFDFGLHKIMTRVGILTLVHMMAFCLFLLLWADSSASQLTVLSLMRQKVPLPTVLLCYSHAWRFGVFILVGFLRFHDTLRLALTCGALNLSFYGFNYDLDER